MRPMIVHFPYPRHAFLDFLRTRRMSLVAALQRAQDDVTSLAGDASSEGRLRLRVAKEVRNAALRREGERESISAAVRNLLVAAFLCPAVLPSYGMLAARGRTLVGATSVSLSPCEPVYIVVLRRTGLRTLHNLVDHLLAVPAIVETAHALFRLPPEEYDQAVADACALASDEVAVKQDNPEANTFS